MTVKPLSAPDPWITGRPKDWAELGGMVQRAARRAMAIYLVEAAAQTAATGTDHDPPVMRSDGP